MYSIIIALFLAFILVSCCPESFYEGFTSTKALIYDGPIRAFQGMFVNSDLTQEEVNKSYLTLSTEKPGWLEVVSPLYYTEENPRIYDGPNAEYKGLKIKYFTDAKTGPIPGSIIDSMPLTKYRGKDPQYENWLVPYGASCQGSQYTMRPNVLGDTQSGYNSLSQLEQDSIQEYASNVISELPTGPKVIDNEFKTVTDKTPDDIAEELDNYTESVEGFRKHRLLGANQTTNRGYSQALASMERGHFENYALDMNEVQTPLMRARSKPKKANRMSFALLADNVKDNNDVIEPGKTASFVEAYTPCMVKSKLTGGRRDDNTEMSHVKN